MECSVVRIVDIREPVAVEVTHSLKSAEGDLEIGFLEDVLRFQARTVAWNQVVQGYAGFHMLSQRQISVSVGVNVPNVDDLQRYLLIAVNSAVRATVGVYKRER